MKTNPVEELLPKVPLGLQQKLNYLSEAIEEVVNFGTHIIKWDVEKGGKGVYSYVPSTFIRSIIEIADSISILVKHSAIDPSKIQVRALLESCLGLTYMLEKEKERASCWIVWRAHKDINFFNKLLSSEKACVDLKKKLLSDEIPQDLSHFFDHHLIIKGKKRRLKLFDNPEFKEIEIEYQRKLKKKLWPNWYSLYDGPENMSQLAELLNKNYHYEFLYTIYSENVHGTDLHKGVAIGFSGTADLIQLRDFTDSKEVALETIKLINAVYKVFIKSRIPERANEFINWQRDYRNDFSLIFTSEISNAMNEIHQT